MRTYPPERIVCLTEETVETLYLLGEEDRIVGVSGYAVRPKRVRKEKPRVSAFTSADIPKILALSPDLVLTFSDLQADIAAELIRAGVAVMAYNQRDIEGILAMIRHLGATVGQGRRAARLADHYEQRLASITARTERSPRLKVYFEEWDAPMISGIQWVSELVEIAGGEDVFPGLAQQGAAKDRFVTSDQVIAAAPDVILASWCGKKVRPEKIAARQGWHTIPAVRDNRIIEIKSPLILQPGPAALTDGLDAILAALTPSDRDHVMTIASPCTGVCKLDEETGWCIGCGRTGEEMDGWRVRSEASRLDIWDEIPERLHQLGVSCRRLPWTTEDIRAFATSTLQAGRGTWVIGVVGAVAEFTAARDEVVDLRIEGDDVVAQTRNGAIRMTINDDIRALTFDPPGLMAEPRIVLAVKRERGRLPLVQGVSDLGPDPQALLQEKSTRLYDLSLGHKEGRFCVRLGQGPAQSALDGAKGLPFSQALPMIAGALVAESPTRVVESALGRIEVQGQIPPPDAASPDGPHTHLLPDHLATKRALPVGMDLPRAYLPGAIFYPPN